MSLYLYDQRNIIKKDILLIKNKIMNKKTIIIVLVILVIIILITAFQSYFRSDQTEVVEIPVNTGNEPGEVMETVTALHQFENGKHVVAGELNLPTPCHVLNSEVIIAESMPEQVLVNLNHTTLDDGLCAQVITPAKYKVEFNASERAVIRGAVNGTPVQFNLVEVGPGESLEDFEVYIKG